MLHYRSESQGLPIGVGLKPHIFETLFCEFVLILPHPFSTVATSSQLLAALLKPSQPFSILRTTLLNSSQVFSSLPTSAQLFSPLSFRLFTSTHLFSSLLNSSQLFSPLAISSQLFQPLLTSAQLILPLLSSSQLFPPFPTSFKREKLLHREVFTHQLDIEREGFAISRLLHTASFAQRSFYTQQALTQRWFLDIKA